MPSNIKINGTTYITIPIQPDNTLFIKPPITPLSDPYTNIESIIPSTTITIEVTSILNSFCDFFLPFFFFLAKVKSPSNLHKYFISTLFQTQAIKEFVTKLKQLFVSFLTSKICTKKRRKNVSWILIYFNSFLLSLIVSNFSCKVASNSARISSAYFLVPSIKSFEKALALSIISVFCS